MNETKEKIKFSPLLIVISILLASLIGLSIFYIIKDLKDKPKIQEKYEYRITYYDDYIPGSQSDIKIYEDKIVIETTHYCSALDCNSSTSTETYNYSIENIDKLKDFIDNNFYSRDFEISRHNLNEREYEVITGILLGEKFFELAIEDYEYKIEYSKNDRTSYDIYFKKNNSILVKKSNINSDYDITNIQTYKLNFKKENINKLFDYVKKESKKEHETVINKYSTLQKDEINIFKSIEENDESYLDDAEEVTLLYTITYNGINCPTPTLYLYSDNTYEYYYTFGYGNKKLTPITGEYNYDMNKLIENINNYKPDSIGPYNIKTETRTYTTYSTNEELKELLDTIGIELEKCTELEK